MASTTSVTVPPEESDAVRHVLLTIYQSHAEALHGATRAYLTDGRSLDPLLDCRAELAEIDALIDLVGWEFGATGDAVELVGPPALVRETVYATLVDSAERFVRDIDRYERGEVELDRLRTGARAAEALFRVFVALEEAAA